MKELDEIKTIFLAHDVDDETRQENEEIIAEWQRTLRQNEAYARWQDHAITKQVSGRAKEAYLAASLRLATDRNITEQIRFKLWAEQDACLWVLSLTELDATGAILALKATVASRLAATK